MLILSIKMLIFIKTLIYKKTIIYQVIYKKSKKNQMLIYNTRQLEWTKILIYKRFDIKVNIKKTDINSLIKNKDINIQILYKKSIKQIYIIY